MEDYDREIILANIDTIAAWTDYDKLKNGCIDKDILSVETIQEIEVSLLVYSIVCENKLSGLAAGIDLEK